MPDQKHILIAGASIAGPALAWFLVRTGHKVTIVERSPSFRTGGQQIDLSGLGIDVVRRMGLYDKIKSATVQNKGFKFVDAADKTFAYFPADEQGQSESRPGLVREVEILRGDMANILYAEIESSVEFMFDNYITALTDKADGITVGFANGSDRDFDLVVAADGLGSKTRSIAFGKDSSYIKSLGQCTAFFSIPWKESDATFDRAFNGPERRIVFLRPQKKVGITGAYLSIMDVDTQKLARLPIEDQKAEFTRLFSGLGWEVPRILKAMNEECDDFYAQEIAQVKAKSYTKGRTVLLGDAGYCPSPISGQGTTLAFVGAYLLAGCIASYPDHAEAFQRYESHMRPIAEKAQNIIPGAPGIASPSTAWGVWFFQTVIYLLGLVWNGGLGKVGEYVLAPLFSALGAKSMELPEFPAFEGILSATKSR